MKVGNTTQNVVELVGNVPIKYQNTSYSVVTHIVFPLPYPSCAPVFRIKNLNPEKFCVNNKYLNNYTGDGFIVLYMSETQTWSSHQNVLRLIQQMQKELSEVFPFFERKQPFQNSVANQQPPANINNPPQGQNNLNPYMQQQQYGQQPQPSSYNYNPSIPGYGGYNQPQQGYGQQPPYAGMVQPQQPPPNPFGPSPVMGNPLPISQPVQPQQNYAALVTAKLKTEIEPIFKKLMEEVKEERQNLDSVYQLKIKADENEAAINQMEEDLKEKMEQIVIQISELKDFVQHNDSVTITKENVATFISEESPLQTQILTLVAEKDAFKETFSFAEAAFKSKRIDFDTFIRTTSQLSEQEFDNKLLLKKCILQIQKG